MPTQIKNAKIIQQPKTMKKQQSQCKQHVELIDQLLNENMMIKEKYQKLLKEHDQLRNRYHRLQHQRDKGDHKENGVEFGIEDLVMEKSVNTNAQVNRFSKNVDVEMGDIDFQDFQITPDPKPNQKVQFKQKQINEFQRTSKQIRNSQLRSSRSSSRSSSFVERFFPLIEGCFIIQKKKCYHQKQKNSLSQMLQFIYPQQLAKPEKQTLEMMLKYTFVNTEIIKSEDDQFNSRKNEIMFGTPYEDYMYAFEDGKWIGKRQLPEILRLMGTMKKKYYHILVRPEVIEKEQMENSSDQNSKKTKAESQGQKEEENIEYFYETEVIYGFISPFPLRNFFQDLHRTIQQELKYSQFEVDEHKQQVYNPTKNRKNKYTIMGKIMKKIYEQQYKLNKFPINLSYKTGITKIQLNVPTLVSYRGMEDQFLNLVLSKYDHGKIIKLLHYVLAEKCILIEAGDRRSLNQLFEMIRIFIRPFLWIFAIVYVYSDYFQPFMSSPMPIIIGKVSQQVQQENEEKEQKQAKTRQYSVDYSEFFHIKMDEEQEELKETDPYYKTIKKFKKQWEKSEANKKQSRAGMIHNYVHSLRVFVEKGILNSEPTDFHIEFMDTQMVSYFKDTLDQ